MKSCLADLGTLGINDELIFVCPERLRNSYICLQVCGANAYEEIMRRVLLFAASISETALSVHFFSSCGRFGVIVVAARLGSVVIIVVVGRSQVDSVHNHAHHSRIYLPEQFTRSAECILRRFS